MAARGRGRGRGGGVPPNPPPLPPPTIEQLLCNTLKFASFKNRFNRMYFGILELMKHRKIKFFIKLKFIIRFSNMFVHTCLAFDVFD